MKVAFVIQRYGSEICGGAEAMTLQIAERLVKSLQVEVITTCAKDYLTWENEYSEGKEKINGVLVHRFKTEHPRKKWTFRIINRLIRILPPFLIFKKIEDIWIQSQGPYVPQLVSYIDQHQKNYDAFFFVTYLYYTTVKGILAAPEKAVLISTAHDEPEIRLPLYPQIFNIPQHIIYMTPEERDFIQMTFRNHHIPHNVIAMGIEETKIPLNKKEIEVLREVSAQPFILYIGRIDLHKGCQELFDYFIRFKKCEKIEKKKTKLSKEKSNFNNSLRLVLIGPANIPIPQREDIIYLGSVSESLKWSLLEQMKFLIMPSKYESLSIVIMEAWLKRKPVLVNGNTPVLLGQVTRSNGGFAYTNFDEFTQYTNNLINNSQIANECGHKGFSYLEKNYRWDKVIDGYRKIVDTINKKKTMDKTYDYHNLSIANNQIT